MTSKAKEIDVSQNGKAVISKFKLIICGQGFMICFRLLKLYLRRNQRLISSSVKLITA